MQTATRTVRSQAQVPREASVIGQCPSAARYQRRCGTYGPLDGGKLSLDQPLTKSTTGTSEHRASVIACARGARGGGGGRYSGGGYTSSSSPTAVDRIVAALPYLIPFFNSIQYGRYLFFTYPAAKAALVPILPIMSLYHSVPFASLFVFFGVFMLIVNNKSFARFVRFNAMQALLLDVSLVLPRLVEMVFTPPTSGPAAKLYLQSQSFIFIFVGLLVCFGVVNCFMGVWGRIPFLADAADSQLH